MHVTKSLIIAALVLLCLPMSLSAAPSNPIDLRVSDTESWPGSPTQPAVAGVSQHPYFSATYRVVGQARPACKMRVQVALNADFSLMHWDSGFVAVSPVAPHGRTQNVAYAGPPLVPGMTLFWRCALQDTHGVSGPFSAGDQRFMVAPVGGAADLRVKTGGAQPYLQGDPALIAINAPTFSAEYMPAAAPAEFVQVQVGTTRDLGQPTWDSTALPVASVSPGSRSPQISYQGPGLQTARAYFWRIRFGIDPDSMGPWSASPASFMVQPPDPSAVPGWFTRASDQFGFVDNADCDIAVADLDGSGTLDCVVATAASGMSHMILRDFAVGAAVPPIPLGAGNGMRTLTLATDFNGDGAMDVVFANQAELKTYRNSAEGFVLAQLMHLGLPAPICFLRVGDVNWDGRPDLVLATTSGIWVCSNVEGVFQQPVQLPTLPGGVDGLVLADLTGSGSPLVVILSAGQVIAYQANMDGGVEEIGVWETPNVQAMAVVEGAPGEYGQLVCAGQGVIRLLTLDSFGYWQTSLELTVPLPGTAVDVVLSDLDGSGAQDVVLVQNNASYVLLMTDLGFELRQFAGNLGDQPPARIVVAPADGDSSPDLVLLQPGARHHVLFNGSPITADISNSQGFQPIHGEGYLEFPVTLSAPPGHSGRSCL